MRTHTLHKQYENFIMRFNKVTNYTFRGDDRSKMNFISRIKDGFTIDEIISATRNCFSDDWHKKNPQLLTPEFILRSDKLQKYLFYGVSNLNKKKVVIAKSAEELHNEMIENRKYQDNLHFLACKKHKYTEEELNEPYISKNSNL